MNNMNIEQYEHMNILKLLKDGSSENLAQKTGTYQNTDSTVIPVSHLGTVQ